MIIGFEAKRVFQNRSGLGNYSRNTINMLTKYFPKNRCILFTPKPTDLFVIPQSAKIITPKSFFHKIFKPYWRLHKVSKLIVENKIELFHGLSHALPYGIEKTGIPSVVTIHDLIFERFPEYYKRIDRKMYRNIYLSSCQRATKIIAISEQTKTDLITYYGIESDKIEVIYQSCDSRFYDKVVESQKLATQLKFNLPDKFVLCVGTIEPRKNQLAILKGIVKKRLDITIVILGKPTKYINELNQFIKESGIEKQVIFLHDTTIDELRAIYQMAEVMVYPSFFEGFGLPVLEAQASGCPVITSNISSLPEAGGDGAIYINPADFSDMGQALSLLLTNQQIKNDLIQKGSANAALFREKLVATKLMNFFTKVVNEV